MRHDDSIKGYKRQRKWNFPPNIIMFNWIGRSPTCFHGKWHTAMALHTALALVFRGESFYLPRLTHPRLELAPT
jgi:hypothetical protein